MLEQVTYSGLRVSIQGDEGDVRNGKSLLTESLGADFGSSSLTCLGFLFCFVFLGALQQHVFQGGEDLPEGGVSVQTTPDCRLGA